MPEHILEVLRDCAARRGAAFRVYRARSRDELDEVVFSDEELRRFEAQTQPMPVLPI